MSKWRKADGSIREHPKGHHGHTATGLPVYHHFDACFGSELHGFSAISNQWRTWFIKGQGENHHEDLDHHHEED